MGQAYDEDGNLLGEAEGKTKKEVFDKLQAAHANAAEIRIKSLMKQIREEESKVPLEHQLIQDVRDIIKQRDSFSHLLGEVLGTLRVNVGRGFISGDNEKTQAVFLELLEKWERKYKEV